MCVIVHKPTGIAIPNDEVLKNCFNKNPHGSGILLYRQNSSHLEIHKGLMTFEDFKNTLTSLNIQVDDELVLHFRITTSGGTNPENCHPFPISSDINQLKQLRINTKQAFVHNGILGKGDEKLKLSDTQLFVQEVMAAPNVVNYLDDKMVQQIIEQIADSSGSKFFVADAEKKIFERYGKWYEVNSCFYSNVYWQHTSYSHSFASSNWSSYYTPRSYKNYDYLSKKSSKQINSSGYPILDDNINWDDIDSYKTNHNTLDKTDIEPKCPFCDSSMEKITGVLDIYKCPKCDTLYDHKLFAIFNEKSNSWESIYNYPDLQDFPNY